MIGNTLPEDTRSYQMILKLKMVLKLLLKLLLLLLTAKLAKLLLRLSLKLARWPGWGLFMCMIMFVADPPPTAAISSSFNSIGFSIAFPLVNWPSQQTSG